MSKTHLRRQVQAKRSADRDPVPGKRTRVQNSVQMKAAQAARAARADTRAAAAAGIAGSSSVLPFLGPISASFGRHDVGSVRAHTGGEAQEASAQIGANAYAMGDDVAFASTPDLHTAAHEAAHVLQQRSGVSLDGGVGKAGDPYEQHADRVADLVVQGKSAESALDEMVGGGGSSVAVQRDEVEATAEPAQQSFDDGSGFWWVGDNDGVVFTCVKTPADFEHRIGFEIREDDSPEAWAMLRGKWEALQPEVIDEKPADVAPPPPSDGGVFDMLPSLPSLGDVLGGVGEAVSGVVDSVAGAAESAFDFFFGDEEKDVEEKPPGEPESELDKEAAERAAERKRLLEEEGIEDNLKVAKDLADGDFEVPHNHDDAGKKVAGDAKNSERPEAILAGDKDALKSINCGEFTSMVLVDAGWDLSQEYIDKDSGLPVAYVDNKGNLAFVTLIMLTNVYVEATRAVLEIQNGTAEKIVGDSDRDKELGGAGRDYWFTSGANFAGAGGIEAKDSHEFGAGLVAVALGGIEVDGDDRKPGDLQQRLNLRSDGKFSGAGHSSQIWAVEGTGVAYLGASGSPELKGAEVEGEGWYEVNDAKLVVTPDTDPSKVASFECEEFQLIDANIAGNKNEDGERRTGDAIDIGRFSAEQDDRMYSVGRLPTSAWIDWMPSEKDVLGVL